MDSFAPGATFSHVCWVKLARAFKAEVKPRKANDPHATPLCHRGVVGIYRHRDGLIRKLILL
jgi:hypothetical protein